MKHLSSASSGDLHHNSFKESSYKTCVEYVQIGFS